MDDLVKDFLTESYENLARLDEAFVQLEKNSSDKESISSIFRTIHTIKGTAGFFGYEKLQRLTHVGENLLSRLRAGELVITVEMTSTLLGMVDAVREMLGAIENAGTEGDRQYPELIDRLTALTTGAPAPAPVPLAAAPAPSAPATPVVTPAPVTPPAPTPTAAAPAVPAPATPLKTAVASTAAPASAAKPAPVAAAPSPAVAPSVSVPGPADPPKPAAAAAPAASKAPEAADKPAENKGRSVSDSTVRVDVGLLDRLMNLVGELVLARNQVLQFSNTNQDSTLVATSQRLNMITSELQEGVMKTRMQPIGNIWNQIPRVVRDLALACGKKVQVEMEGKETDLDRTIIEAIKDPLTHLVRNSVDHGIEPPERRREAGKPEMGTLTLRAYHEGGQVNIEIADDGGGLNPEKIKNSALKKGLITPEDAARLSEREMVNLIFLPGFSTAEKVTNVSGRGVGMDVVKTNIEKIGGTVDLHSKLGAGVTVKIKIPLTLAIIPALIVTTRGERFAIPQVSLLELVRLEPEQVAKCIERVAGAPVYRLRGHLLPLVFLNEELQLAARPTAGDGSAADDGVSNIVVLQADGQQFGLVVDGISDTEEIVVKPLGKQLKGVVCYSGATIMGDGKVALILDILGIAQRAKVFGRNRDRAAADDGKAGDKGQQDGRRSLLLFGLSEVERVAIPLEMVARLEELPRSLVECADDREVVQYRGQIMPLINLTHVLRGDGGAAKAISDPMAVVVYSQNGRSVGLVVNRIIDIVEDTIDIKRRGQTRGVLGSAVIQQKVTNVLDLETIIRDAEPTFFSAEPAAATSEAI